MASWLGCRFLGLLLRLPGLLREVFEEIQSEGDDSEHGVVAGEPMVVLSRSSKLPMPIISGRLMTLPSNGMPSSDSYVMRISAVGRVPMLDRPEELRLEDVGDIEPDDDNEVDEGDSEAIDDGVAGTLGQALGSITGLQLD